MQHDLRDLVKERFKVEPEHKNIFFQVNEMEDEFNMSNYSIKVNNMNPNIFLSVPKLHTILY